MDGRVLFRVALILTTVAQAASAPQTATVSLPPVDDAYVKSSTPTTTYGSMTTLRVREGSSETLNTYLKFDVDELTGFVRTATLRLYVTDASSDGGSLYRVSNAYYGSTTPWSESGLNWNNAPAISGAALASG
jgi:hypothetical protein